jgi:hypothetical protein
MSVSHGTKKTPIQLFRPPQCHSDKDYINVSEMFFLAPGHVGALLVL